MTASKLFERPLRLSGAILISFFMLTSFAMAGEKIPVTVNSGDTAWMMVSIALVMLMTPALALYYGGMVRRKNILGTIMQSFVSMAVVSIIWVLYGYSLSFGPDIGHLIGNLDWAGLRGVTLQPNTDYAATIPHQAFMLFQMMFAAITPALISGAFAERFKFKSYLLFLILWTTFVYCPLAHWVWGVGGWIREMGALDYAGGLVVHISSGFSALAAAIMVGKRKGFTKNAMPPHNLGLTLLGTGLLWFGWFGFNGGSALGANEMAVSAIVATHLASAAAAISWFLIEWKHHGKPTVLGVASGAVAGLVAITPACGFVSVIPAIIIGFVAGIICYAAVSLKYKFKYDDSLDAVGVHGVGGLWGAIAVGIFASKNVNALGANGLIFGGYSLLGVQLVSILAAIGYSFFMTAIILKSIDWLTGLRVSEEQEVEGLDFSQHGERGYIL
jgi:Amt family ammonium transporter